MFDHRVLPPLHKTWETWRGPRIRDSTFWDKELRIIVIVNCEIPYIYIHYFKDKLGIRQVKDWLFPIVFQVREDEKLHPSILPRLRPCAVCIVPAAAVSAFLEILHAIHIFWVMAEFEDYLISCFNLSLSSISTSALNNCWSGMEPIRQLLMKCMFEVIYIHTRRLLMMDVISGNS